LQLNGKLGISVHFEPLIFGTIVKDVEYQARAAAYALIVDDTGKIAAVKGKGGYFLPGGGSLPGESSQDTIHRELREEMGRDVTLLRHVAEAIQYFVADDTHYRMMAVFYHVELASEQSGKAEFEPHWLRLQDTGGKFFHQCHEWAIRQSDASLTVRSRDVPRRLPP
jgi:8-oxo-dGTP diphosphatase